MNFLLQNWNSIRQRRRWQGKQISDLPYEPNLDPLLTRILYILKINKCFLFPNSDNAHKQVALSCKPVPMHMLVYHNVTKYHHVLCCYHFATEGYFLAFTTFVFATNWNYVKGFPTMNNPPQYLTHNLFFDRQIKY